MEMTFCPQNSVTMHFALGGAAPVPPDPTIVHGDGIYRIAALSQDDYDALETKNSQTLYIISEDASA